MMTAERLLALLFALVLVSPARRVLAQTNQADSAGAARQFVQSFYDWYTPLSRRDSQPRVGSMTAEIAIKQKSEVFGARLLAALRADFAARAEGKEGLDFDPFNLTQDTPCERYQAGRVTRKQNSYGVDVHPLCGGERTDSGLVVAEVQPFGNSWRFVNFRYPGVPRPDDLVGVPSLLKKERRTP